MSKRWLLWLLAFLLLAIAFIVNVSRDIPEPDTSDLLVVRPEVAPAENAFTYFASITNVYSQSDAELVDQCTVEDPIDDARFQAIVAENATNYDLLRQGLACRCFVVPESTNIFNSTCLHQLGEILAGKARHERRVGRYAQSADTCLTLLKFGCLVNFDGHKIPEWQFFRYGLNQIEDFALDPKAPSAELRRLAAGLAGIGPLVPDFIQAQKKKYKRIISVCDAIRNSKRDPLKLAPVFELTYKYQEIDMFLIRLIPGYFFKLNQTKLLCADECRSVISNAPLDYAAILTFRPEKFRPARSDMYSLPNVIGRYYLYEISHDLDFDLLHFKRLECDLAAVRLLLAIRLFREETGRLPADLNELTPKYLAAVPLDPFDGKPFRYLPAKGVIYSVGEDTKDAGGSIKLITDVYLTSRDQTARPLRGHTEDIVYEIEERNADQKK